MLIPYKFELGQHEYCVTQPYRLPYDDRGRVLYPLSGALGEIRIASHRFDKAVPKRRKVQVFWHETVHAILHDMGMAHLRDDERFVDGFAKRLTQIVYSAQVS